LAVAPTTTSQIYSLVGKTTGEMGFQQKKVIK